MPGHSSKWHWWRGPPHCVHGRQLGCRAEEGPCLAHSLSTGEERTEAYQGGPCSLCSWCPEVAERLVKTVPSWWHSLQEACWFRWSGTEAVVVPSAVSHCHVQATPQWHGTPGAGQDHCFLPRSRLLAWNEQWCGQVDCPMSAMYLCQGSITTSVCSVEEHHHQSTNGDGCFGFPHPRRWRWWSRQCVGHDWPFHKVCHGCANNQTDGYDHCTCVLWFLHSDQGRNFESRIIKELCTIAGVKKTRTTPYYPMGKGCTELFNRTLISMLRTLEEGQKRNWKRFMPQLVHAYNCTRHSTTGASPYYLLFGRQPRLAADVLLNLHTPGSGARCQTEYIKDLQKRLKMTYRVAQYAMKKAASRAKKHYDLRVRGTVPEVWDLVLVKLVGLTGKHKLADKWKSKPYKIIRKPDAGIPVYVVQRCDGSGAERMLHRNMLFPLALPLHNDETQDKDGAVAVDDSLSSDLASVSDDVPRVRTQSQLELDVSSSKSYDSPISLQDGLVPLVASEVDNDVPAGSGDSGAGQDTSLNVPQEIEVAVTPEEERSSEEEESLSSEEESQPLRRSTRNRRPSGQYRDGTYLMYPQIAMTAQWKAEFDVLWSRFPEKRLDLYQRLLKQISDHWWMNCRGRQFLLGGGGGGGGEMYVTTKTTRVNSIAHRVRALPTESPGGRFDRDWINVFFIIWFYIKLVCMCEGCLVICGMIGVINMGFDSFRFMENLLFSHAIDMIRVFPCHHRIQNSVAGREGRVVWFTLL